MKSSSNKIVDNTEKNNKMVEKKENTFEKEIEIDEKWRVTFPEVTVANLEEALKFSKYQESVIQSKIEKENEFIKHQVITMLNKLGIPGYYKEWRDKSKMFYNKGVYYKDVNDELSYRYIKYSNDLSDWYGTCRWLKLYDWSLSGFMDYVAESIKKEIKKKNSYFLESLNLKEWELDNLSNDAIIKKIEESIYKISLEDEEKTMAIRWEYLDIIMRVCEDKFWAHLRM